MDKFIINGGRKLEGTTQVSGAKNVALKAIVAACLTSEKVVIDNIPLIDDLFVMSEIIEELGGKIEIEGHSAFIQMEEFKTTKVTLERAAEIRTSAMFMAPLLARTGEATIPNPGGCRLGARPIDRTIEGLQKLGADIEYESEDGYFHAKTSGLSGITYRFDKNTHTGTETLIIAATLAKGKTTLENAAQEPEIDELIAFINSMGGNIRRIEPRKIEIEGVENLHGTTFRIAPDRNEIVTLAIAAMVTKGDIFVEGVNKKGLEEFLEKLDEANGGYETKDDGIRFYYKGRLRAVNVTTNIYPGFMTDWQAPWTVLMTQAEGESTVHETVFENKLGHIADLKKMGAKVELFNPPVDNPEETYNFNSEDDSPEYFHAVRINGPTKLHNAVIGMLNLRAGAAVVLAALAAEGESVILEVHHLDRGYEKFEDRLNSLGAQIRRIEEDKV